MLESGPPGKRGLLMEVRLGSTKKIFADSGSGPPASSTSLAPPRSPRPSDRRFGGPVLLLRPTSSQSNCPCFYERRSVTETTAILPVLAPTLKDLKPHMVVKNPMIIRFFKSRLPCCIIKYHSPQLRRNAALREEAEVGINLSNMLWTPKVMRANAWNYLTRIFNSIWAAGPPERQSRISC
jgi:hypothetical protein